MGMREDVKYMLATADLDTCKMFGVVVHYAHQGGEHVDLWATPSKMITKRETTGSLEVVTQDRYFSIPCQPNFPFPGIISQNDSITFEGEKYSVVSFDVDSLGAIYRVYVETQTASGLIGD